LLQPNPAEPYFASQLVDHLYDKTPRWCRSRAGWRHLPKILSELNLREQNRQTKDQISIGNAFTSLRQLACWIGEGSSSVSARERLLRFDPSGVYSGWILIHAIGIAGRLKTRRRSGHQKIRLHNTPSS